VFSTASMSFGVPLSESESSSHPTNTTHSKGGIQGGGGVIKAEEECSIVMNLEETNLIFSWLASAWERAPRSDPTIGLQG